MVKYYVDKCRTGRYLVSVSPIATLRGGEQSAIYEIVSETPIRYLETTHGREIKLDWQKAVEFARVIGEFIDSVVAQFGLRHNFGVLHPQFGTTPPNPGRYGVNPEESSLTRMWGILQSIYLAILKKDGNKYSLAASLAKLYEQTLYLLEGIQSSELYSSDEKTEILQLTPDFDKLFLEVFDK